MRGRRISSIDQIAFDRVVHMKFGSDFESQESRQDHEFHLYLELFAQGNVILTNWEGRILAILRPVEVESVGKLAVGELYDPTKGALDLKELSSEVLKDGIATSPSTLDLKTLARGPLAAFSPQMTEFCCKSIGISGKLPIEKVDEFVKVANELIREILTGDKFLGLLQLQKEVQSKEQLLDPKFPALLHAFHPLNSFSCLKPANGDLYSFTFPTFNEAVDVYFSRLEAEKTSQKQVNCELEAEKKLAAIGAEQQSRIAGLRAAVEIYREKGQLVTEFCEEAEAALKVARSAVGSGMDWKEFGRLIEAEKKNSNVKRAAVAGLYAGLKLESGQISLKLEEVVVDLVIGLSAHANATRLYDLRTQARLKMERTCAIHEVAMKSAAAKIRSEMLQSRQLGRVRQLQALRKPFWFEKFAWFNSSDGFLVLAGRDAQQNELLVKKYLGNGDVYVHADVHGAGSLVVKNHMYPALKTPPPKTLHEAGTFSICFSRAWEAKIVTSAWWVRAEQVSKTAPSGEYLGTGSFMIRGHKNFLPPMQLSLSFGFLFALDEEKRKEKMIERKRREAEGSFEDEQGDAYEKYRIEPVGSSDSAVIVNTAVPVEVKKTQKALKALKLEAVEPTTPAKTALPAEKKSTRGKHGKEKKMKKKYGDQDEEERAMRLELLGSVAKKPETGKNKAGSGKGEKSCMTEKTEKQPVYVTGADTKDTVVIDKPTATLEASPNVEEEDQEESSVEFIAADYFTEMPDESSSYLFAMPVCFPTSALSSAKFRVKLIPGNLKKGKAAKSVLSLLTNPSSCSVQQWKDLMRAVPENEMVAVMPAKVALGVSGHDTKKLKKPKKKQKKPKN